MVFDLGAEKFDFILMAEFAYPGTFLLSSFEYDVSDLKLGYRTWLKNIPVGSFIHNLSVKPQVKAKYIRSAGTKGQIIQKTLSEVKVRLPSGIILIVSNLAIATIGGNSFIQKKNKLF